MGRHAVPLRTCCPVPVLIVPACQHIQPGALCVVNSPRLSLWNFRLPDGQSVQRQQRLKPSRGCAEKGRRCIDVPRVASISSDPLYDAVEAVVLLVKPSPYRGRAALASIKYAVLRQNTQPERWRPAAALRRDDLEVVVDMLAV